MLRVGCLGGRKGEKHEMCNCASNKLESARGVWGVSPSGHLCPIEEEGRQFIPFGRHASAQPIKADTLFTISGKSADSMDQMGVSSRIPCDARTGRRMAISDMLGSGV
jgi:hypothetical protein